MRHSALVILTLQFRFQHNAQLTPPPTWGSRRPHFVREFFTSLAPNRRAGGEKRSRKPTTSTSQNRQKVGPQHAVERNGLNSEEIPGDADSAHNAQRQEEVVVTVSLNEIINVLKKIVRKTFVYNDDTICWPGPRSLQTRCVGARTWDEVAKLTFC